MPLPIKLRTTALTLVLLCLGGAGATLASGSDEASQSANTKTFFIRGIDGKLQYVGPETIRAGSNLRVVNQTNPAEIGPHTLSLVTRKSLAKTEGERQNCFTKNHICKEIAAWHGTDGRSPITENPTKAGKKGWDVAGNGSRKGDSWFAGQPGASITQKVTANTSDGPRRFFFQCAIHPFMRGTVKVLPNKGG